MVRRSSKLGEYQHEILMLCQKAAAFSCIPPYPGSLRLDVFHTCVPYVPYCDAFGGKSTCRRAAGLTEGRFAQMCVTCAYR